MSSITRDNTLAYWAGCDNFPYTLKAGPAGGRLRRPSSRAGSTTTATGAPASSASMAT
jgi:hypothetical protein